MIHLDDRLGLEVNVSIKCKQKCVLCSHLLSQPKISCRSVFDMVCYLFLGVCQRLIIHQLMAKEVVHVHDLRPPEILLVFSIGGSLPFLVSDFVLVFQVADDLSFPWQSPYLKKVEIC